MQDLDSKNFIFYPKNQIKVGISAPKRKKNRKISKARELTFLGVQNNKKPNMGGVFIAFFAASKADDENQAKAQQ